LKKAVNNTDERKIMIQNYSDFIAQLLKAGFSMAGGNSGGIYAVVPFSWNETPPQPTAIRWHTGDPETDPWEWRMRVLNERQDIAYAKMFFRKGGFVTREWAPCFLAARRQGKSFEEEYADGGMSSYSKRIHEVLQENGSLPVHILKPMAGFGREEQAKFERALVELQMKFYITMCGCRQKISRAGEEYGWSSTVFCTTEEFWSEEVFSEAEKILPEEAVRRITHQVTLLNPEADSKKIRRFIMG